MVLSIFTASAFVSAYKDQVKIRFGTSSSSGQNRRLELANSPPSAAPLPGRAMLLRLPDECRQQVWAFFGFRELCRVSCVARGAALGVDARRLWRRRALELLRDEQAQMRARTGLLGHRLQRGFASRDLLSTGDAPAVSVAGFLRDDGADDGFDWRRWFRGTYLVRALC